MSNTSSKLVFLIAAVSISGMSLLAQSPAVEPLSARSCNGLFMKQPLVTLNDTGITGEALLCIETSGVRSRIVARNLTPGYAYTMWFAYIDQPSMCLTPGQCGDLDYAVPYNPAGVFGRTDSLIAQSGEDVFSANVRSFHAPAGLRFGWLRIFMDQPEPTITGNSLASY
jgi:hypothetical protein